MARARKSKEIDRIIDEGASRLGKLTEQVLAERAQQIASSTGRWRINRVGEMWVMLDQDDRVEFEDSGIPTIAFLIEMYADPREKPQAVVKRFYGDLFESDA